jgi:hypothetical protein
MKQSRFTNSQILSILKQVEGGTGARIMPRARHQLGDLLQMAFEIQRHGRVVDGATQGTGRLEPPAQKDVCGRTPQSRDPQGSLGKKGLTPSCRREMAREMVQAVKQL